MNNNDIAVGFFIGKAGNAHAFEFSIPGGWFRRMQIPGAVSTTATGINNRGDIVGFFTNTRRRDPGASCSARTATLTRLTVPGASSTMAFGVNDQREVVGTYMVGSGSKAKSFGFVWSSGTWGSGRSTTPRGSGAPPR